MSVLGTLISRIFHHGQDNQSTTSAPAAAAPAQTTQATTPTAQPADVPTAPPQSVDVTAILDGMASKYNHPVNWRYSIVDLMALLGMDNSLEQRRELARELGYTGDTNDTAKMNTWLHEQVMQKLAENGGKVPPDLLKH